MPDCEWFHCLESAAMPSAYPLFCEEHWREVQERGAAADPGPDGNYGLKGTFGDDA